MTIRRREFCVLATGTVAATILPAAAAAKEVKLRSGEIYKVIVGQEETADILIYPNAKFDVRAALRAGRDLGLKMERGDTVALTDDPRAFELSGAQISALGDGPVVLGVSHYWCADTPDGASYGCWSDD